jgi:hypothetical protein
VLIYRRMIDPFCQYRRGIHNFLILERELDFPRLVLAAPKQLVTPKGLTILKDFGLFSA